MKKIIQNQWLIDFVALYDTLTTNQREELSNVLTETNKTILRQSQQGRPAETIEGLTQLSIQAIYQRIKQIKRAIQYIKKGKQVYLSKSNRLMVANENKKKEFTSKQKLDNINLDAIADAITKRIMKRIIKNLTELISL